MRKNKEQRVKNRFKKKAKQNMRVDLMQQAREFSGMSAKVQTAPATKEPDPAKEITATPVKAPAPAKPQKDGDVTEMVGVLIITPPSADLDLDDECGESEGMDEALFITCE